MTYRIEYLTSSVPSGVCHALTADSADLDGAEEEAYARSEVPRVLMGVTGFQIRESDAGDAITVVRLTPDQGRRAQTKARGRKPAG